MHCFNNDASMHYLKLQDVLHTNILTFIYKVFNKLSPSCFHDYFQPNAMVHRIGTRQATRAEVTSLVLLKILPCMVFKLFNILALNFGILFQSTFALSHPLQLFGQN